MQTRKPGQAAWCVRHTHSQKDTLACGSADQTGRGTATMQTHRALHNTNRETAPALQAASTCPAWHCCTGTTCRNRNLGRAVVGCALRCQHAGRAHRGRMHKHTRTLTQKHARQWAMQRGQQQITCGCLGSSGRPAQHSGLGGTGSTLFNHTPHHTTESSCMDTDTA